MSEPELNDLLKLLEEKYHKKSDAGRESGGTPPVGAAQASSASPPLPPRPQTATPAAPGLITSFSMPRKSTPPPASSPRRPPPSAPTSWSSTRGGSAPAPSASGSGTFTGGTPSAFGGGTPSAFGGGTPSAFGGGGATAGGAQGGAATAASTPQRAGQIQTPSSSEPAQAHYGLVVKPVPKALNTALRQIDPASLIRAIRPRIGPQTSLWMFRAAYFMGFLQPIGHDHLPWSQLAGRKFGQLVEIPDYDSIDRAFRAMKMGRVTILEEVEHVVFEVSECLICDGLMGFEEPCCGFIGGLLNGVVQRVTGRDAVVRETKCCAMHHEACRFEVGFNRGPVTTRT